MRLQLCNALKNILTFSITFLGIEKWCEKELDPSLFTLKTSCMVRAAGLNYKWWEKYPHCSKSFPLRISSVNMTKSYLFTITEEILNGKLHFLCCDRWLTRFLTLLSFYTFLYSFYNYLYLIFSGGMERDQ